MYALANGLAIIMECNAQVQPSADVLAEQAVQLFEFAITKKSHTARLVQHAMCLALCHGLVPGCIRLKRGASREGSRLVVEGARCPALSISINCQAGVGIQQLKGAILLGYEEPALVGTIPGVPLLDAGSSLTAHTVHLQALAAAYIQDAVGPIADGLECPQLVGRLIGLPTQQSGMSDWGAK